MPSIAGLEPGKMPGGVALLPDDENDARSLSGLLIPLFASYSSELVTVAAVEAPAEAIGVAPGLVFRRIRPDTHIHGRQGSSDRRVRVRGSFATPVHEAEIGCCRNLPNDLQQWWCEANSREPYRLEKMKVAMMFPSHRTASDPDRVSMRILHVRQRGCTT